MKKCDRTDPLDVKMFASSVQGLGCVKEEVNTSSDSCYHN